MADINNMPKEHERYAVCREFDNELWYWGSWDDKDKAECVAENIGGVVVDTDE